MESTSKLILNLNDKTALTGTINVGSRKSQLALIQTNLVIEKLNEFYSNNPDRWIRLLEERGQKQPESNDYNELKFNVVAMTTTGDRILDKPLPTIGTKSLFTRELETELLEGRVDFVVHSLKDLPTTLPEGLTIGAVMKRDDPDDTIVLKESLRSKMDPLDLLLGQGGAIRTGGKEFKVGTSSQRRIAMIKRCNPNLECIDIRGNLNTRLSKLDNEDGEYAAIILARAGLDRMGWSERASCQLKPSNDPGLSGWCYAVGQGAIAVECRANDSFILEFLSPIINLKTTYEVVAERNLMKKLEAGCSVPLGVRSSWTDAKECKEEIFHLRAIVLSVDGQTVVEACGEFEFSGIQATPPLDTKTLESLDSITTSIDVSKSESYCPSVLWNITECSRMGIEIANKMIGLGCRELLS